MRVTSTAIQSRAAFQKLLQNKLATVCFVVLILEILLVALAPLSRPMGMKSRTQPMRWPRASGPNGRR